MNRIKEVSEKVFNQIRKEQKEEPLRGAVGLVEAFEDNKPVNYLIYNKRKTGASRRRRDITGAVIGTELAVDREEYALIEHAQPVSRDSPEGANILANRHGEYIRQTNNGQILIKVGSFISYSKKFGHIDAYDGTYSWELDQEEPFVSLKGLLQVQGLTEDKQRLEERLKAEKEASELQKLRDELEQLVTLEESKREKQRRYIRKTNQLRSQFLLDKVQDQIRRNAVLDGALILDGGPGTGKTTTLIQRITFLTNTETIGKYRQELSAADIEELENSWIFISPSALLKAFLKDNMSHEGLKIDQQHLVVWDDYLTRIFRNYNLIDSDSNNGFKLRLAHEQRLFQNYTHHLDKAAEIINNASIHDIKTALERSAKINLKDLKWEKLGSDIKREIQLLESKNTLLDLLLGLHSLNTRYTDAVLNELSGLNDQLKVNTQRLQNRLKQTEPQLYEDLVKYLNEEFIRKEKLKGQTIESIEETDELDIDSVEIVEIPEQKEFQEIIEVNRFLGSLLQAAALASLKRGITPPNKFKEWLPRFETALNILPLEVLGEKVLLRRFWNRPMRDGANYSFSRFVGIYKASRLNLADALLDHKDEKILAEIKDDRSRIYKGEKNFIIWYLNTLLGTLSEKNKAIYNKLSHPYKASYEAAKKCVIAVDESTDFSIVELAAISSLADIRYKSVTLSGDLMQSMESSGIRTWEEVQKLLGASEVYRLRKSYRQTATLVELASTLYRHVNGIEPDFISNLPKSKHEPKPEIRQTVNDEDTATWLVDQILDIYEQYETIIPSIAIFAHNDVEVDKLTRLLNENDKLIDSDIQVKGCRKDGELRNDDRVVIYNIETIKGLEFEAVFFPNMDLIQTEDESLLQRYLYVGISRAAYFLGLSYREKLPLSLKMFDLA